MLIAIVCVEGTGSFDTNSVVKAGDGGNGPQEDFEKDLDYALDLVGGKVIVYAAYQQSFSEVRQKAYEQGLSGIKDYDDILHYINWQTPRVSLVDTDNCKLASEYMQKISSGIPKSGKYTVSFLMIKYHWPIRSMPCL